MKKLSIILLFAAQFINAQVSWGVKSGLNLSTINDKNIDYDFKTGFYAGGFANIKFAEKLAFQPELLFSMQGAKTDTFPIIGLDENGQMITESLVEIDYKLYYLNIPLMFKYYVIKKLNFELGPQLGFALEKELAVSGEPFGESSIDPEINVDLGVNIGAEYEIYKGLGIGVRYNSGLTKVRKGSDYRNNNSVISFGLSYSFN
ncbi:porin family protein [Moheibacter sediminis]|uniref:Outer membrane protein beta-barrel domain-containing protein n=1 Tax=Moheibacter sediminis TaxID=1434700 RepID=A0A1W2C4P5_9FLAO|nr:porin family protein [Moheibacter sediminis]SMC79984.1 Outer membrane protein beta-barrel domain-containing protein [Moheibacter sediminis]